MRPGLTVVGPGGHRRWPATEARERPTLAGEATGGDRRWPGEATGGDPRWAGERPMGATDVGPVGEGRPDGRRATGTRRSSTSPIGRDPRRDATEARPQRLNRAGRGGHPSQSQGARRRPLAFADRARTRRIGCAQTLPGGLRTNAGREACGQGRSAPRGAHDTRKVACASAGVLLGSRQGAGFRASANPSSRWKRQVPMGKSTSRTPSASARNAAR